MRYTITHVGAAKPIDVSSDIALLTDRFETRRIIHDGYTVLRDICPGVSKGNWVCALCEEVFAVPTKHVEACMPRHPKHRSEPARRFYEWCKSNGYVRDRKPTVTP